nr:hypothetical protein [Tanacetum cinerariifolium]
MLGRDGVNVTLVVLDGIETETITKVDNATPFPTSYSNILKVAGNAGKRNVMVKCKCDNTLVGYFLGKNIAFSLVKNYVNNKWSKFGLTDLMKTDDGVFLFKFASKEGLEQVMLRGPWMIRNLPILLFKWSPTLSLKKGEVNKVPVWVKLYNVPVLAYVGDEMCTDSTLKKEVFMAIENEEGDEYTREVIRMEYDWKPPHCVECKCFENDPNSCHKRVVIPKATPKAPTTSSAVDNKNRKGIGETSKVDTGPMKGSLQDNCSGNTYVDEVVSIKNSFTNLMEELSGLDKNQSVSNAVNAEGNDIGEKDGTTVVNENVMSQP